VFFSIILVKRENALTLQDSWNDLQFGMEGVVFFPNSGKFTIWIWGFGVLLESNGLMRGIVGGEGRPSDCGRRGGGWGKAQWRYRLGNGGRRLSRARVGT